jgi:hypothetical protein
VKVWATACNIRFQAADLQRIIFESIVSTSFRNILVLRHTAGEDEEGNATPEKSKTFNKCLAEATRAIALFDRRSALFGMRNIDKETQPVFLRRC